MTKIIGKNQTFGIVLEDTRGTLKNTGVKFFATEGVEANPEVETILDESSAGTLAEGSDQIVVSKMGNVKIPFKAGLKSIGYIIRAIAGQAPTFVAGTPNEHKFEMSNSATQDSFSTIVANAIQDRGHSLSLLTKFTAELSQKAIPQFSAEFKSKAPVDTAVGESTPEDELLLHTGFEFRYGASLGALTSNDNLCVTNFSFSIDKALNFDQCVSSSEPNDITNGIISVSGSFEVSFENMSYQNDFMNNTKKAIQIIFGGATAGEGVYIDLPNVKLKGAPTTGGVNDTVKQSVEFTALLDKATGKQISLTLKNTEADGTY